MKNHRKDHKTEQRKEIPVSYCMEPTCKFYSKRAAQGICFSTNTKEGDKYLKSVMQQGEDLLKSMKALRKRNGAKKTKEWVKYLEGQVVCTWMNGVFDLDNIVRLRAEICRAEVKTKQMEVGPNEKGKLRVI